MRALGCIDCCGRLVTPPRPKNGSIFTMIIEQADNYTSVSATMRRIAALVERNAPRLLRVHHLTEHHRQPINTPRPLPLTAEQRERIARLSAEGNGPWVISRLTGFNYEQVRWSLGTVQAARMRRAERLKQAA